MKNKSVENDWRNLLYTELKRTGGDPSFLFEILEGIMEQRAWETLLDESGNPVGSLKRLIEAPLPVGCGQPVKKVMRLLEVEHRYETKSTDWKNRMADLRDAMQKELGIEIEAVGRHGGNREASLHVNLPDETKGGNSKEYRIAVLKRDAPDIAERVIEGEISAAAGIRELRVRNGEPEYLRRAVNMTDAESAFNTLTKYMDTGVLYELIERLSEWANDNSSA